MPSFSVANINPGTVRAEFMGSIMALVEYERRHDGAPVDPADDSQYKVVRTAAEITGRIHFGQFFSKLAGPYLDTERNACVEWFINHCVSDYLLFIDSDMSPKPEQAYDLCRIAIQNDLQLIGGTYYNALDGAISPLAYLWRHDEALGQRNLRPIPQAALESMAELTDHAAVDAMGTGMMLIHRSVFDAMGSVYDKPTPWFAELDIDGIQMGEDFTFCVRAAAIGIQPYVAPRIVIDHYKTCVLRQVPKGVSVAAPAPDLTPTLEKV